MSEQGQWGEMYLLYGVTALGDPYHYGLDGHRQEGAASRTGAHDVWVDTRRRSRGNNATRRKDTRSSLTVLWS